MKTTKSVECSIRGAIAAALGTMTICVAGCAVSDPLTSTTTEPRVEDCVIIQQATPARFVCGGKVYASVQLADIRKGKTVTVK